MVTYLSSWFIILSYSEVAIEQVRQASLMSSDSISGYQALQGYVSSLVQSLSAVEEEYSSQRLNLAKFVEQVRDQTWVDIKLVLSTLVALFLPFCAFDINFVAAPWSPLLKNWHGQARLTIFHAQCRTEKPLNLLFSIF